MNGDYLPGKVAIENAMRVMGYVELLQPPKENEPFNLIAHFKMYGKNKRWDKISKNKVSVWFKKFYVPRL